MKKRRSFLFILVLCFLMILGGCTSKDSKEEVTSTSYDLGGKTYYNTVDNYGHEDHAKIWFGKDNSFVLNDSYADGYYEISGKWSLSENVCNLDVESTGKGTYTKIIFEVQDDDTLKLKTSLEGSKSDELFSTTETKGSAVTPKDDSSTIAETEKGDEKKDEAPVSEPSPPEMTHEPIPCTGITSLYHNYWSYEGTKNWDLEIRPEPADTTDPISFKSNDESVVTIDSQGRATAVAPGKTTIEATCGSKKITVGYEVRVKEVEGPKGDGDTLTYTAQISDVQKAYQPSIYLDGAGFFTFTENVYAGMARYKGYYDKKDGKVICTVTDASEMKGFAGEGVTEIVFKIVDEKTLKLKTDLCMSTNGTLFYLGS
ncbi:MAG: Ig-like domain-containing protein [Erysipelotrichaceae bacterium]|nr:Ig-like domain-containing protein [Erysipelotrichaceae bacterium]